MNDQKLWWSGVEERFWKKVNTVGEDWRDMKTECPVSEFGYKVFEKSGRLYTITDFKNILTHFHKEIQNHLHEEAVDSELPK